MDPDPLMANLQALSEQVPSTPSDRPARRGRRHRHRAGLQLLVAIDLWRAGQQLLDERYRLGALGERLRPVTARRSW